MDHSPNGSGSQGLKLNGMVCGLILGAGAGAGLTSLFVIFGMALTGSVLVAVASAPFTLLIGLVVWTIGLLLIGLPCWLILHALGYRSRKIAMIWGGALSFVVAGTVALMLWSAAELGELAVLMAIAAAVGAVGVVVGCIVSAVGYGLSMVVR